MRKLLFPLLLLLFCAGCAKPEPSPPPSPLASHSGSYEAEAEIRRGDLTAAATISRPSPDECTVTFTAPESLAGMAFSFGPEQVEVSYKGLSFPCTAESLPPAAAPGLLVEAVGHALRDDGVEVAPVDTGVELRGLTDSGAYTLLVDAENGCPQKLSLPGADLTIEFVSFTFLD